MIFRQHPLLLRPPYITQVQSHGANIVHEIGNMRLTLLFLISVLSLFAFCVSRSAAYKAVIEIEEAKQKSSHDIIREKREIEEFYNEEYPQSQSQESQEEPGFWDRVVKVALKLFNRFIEWLNSS